VGSKKSSSALLLLAAHVAGLFLHRAPSCGVLDVASWFTGFADLLVGWYSPVRSAELRGFVRDNRHPLQPGPDSQAVIA
jgi:hypothetical protein